MGGTGMLGTILARPGNITLAAGLNWTYEVTVIDDFEINDTASIAQNILFEGYEGQSLDLIHTVDVEINRSIEIQVQDTLDLDYYVDCEINRIIEINIEQSFSLTHELMRVLPDETMSSYVTLQQAQDYFSARLHTGLWDNSSVQDRQKALAEATAAIDRLRFVGYKAAVYTAMQNEADDDSIAEAFAGQELEFPRDTDTDIPSDIIAACCEEAFSRLDGKDPDQELENLSVTHQGFASVRTNYDRTFVHEHLNAGIVSPRAWRYLKPYLQETRDFTIRRV